MQIKQEKNMFNILGYLFITFLALLCILPFLLIISASLTQEQAIIKYGYSFIPKVLSFDAYKVLLKAPKEISQAYGVTATLTILGTAIGLFIIAMTGYVLQRKDFKYRNKFSFFIYFTSLFSGGMIPSYILIVKYLDLKNNFFALLLPSLMNAWYIMLMMNFMKSVPDSIVESAKMDGAGEFKIFIKLIIPLALPGMATVGLFLALTYWNDWFHAMLFIEKPSLFPLQYFLYKTLSSANFAESGMTQASVTMPDMPLESIKMAMSVIVTGPIIFLYPFAQKYFIKGLTVGAVKG